MNLKLVLAATLVIGLSAPALADEPKAADQAPAKEKKICRTETVTGSLVAKRRVCLTRAEWDKLSLDTKHDVDRYTSRGNGIPGEPKGPFTP